MFERFSTTARASVVEAVRIAESQHTALVGREHLLVALAGSGEPTLAEVIPAPEELVEALAALSPTGQEQADADALGAIGIDLAAIKESVVESFGAEAWDAGAPAPRKPSGLIGRLLPNHRPFTAGARKALELALREAIADQSREISSTHLLRAILRDPGPHVSALLPADELAELRTRVVGRAA